MSVHCPALSGIVRRQMRIVRRQMRSNCTWIPYREGQQRQKKTYSFYAFVTTLTRNSRVLRVG
jgi:hypothetical protein